MCEGEALGLHWETMGYMSYGELLYGKVCFARDL